MFNLNGSISVFITILLTFLLQITAAHADGRFRLVLTDGTVVEGEMIRVTSATIEIDPEGPEEFASYNQGDIADIVYMKQKPGGGNSDDPADDQSSNTGILAVRFDLDKSAISEDSSNSAKDYVMIDGRLYFTGLYRDFILKLPSGNHVFQLSRVDMTYHEPTDFYSLKDGGTSTRIWKQSNSSTYGKTMNIDVRRDSVTIISLENRNREFLFVDFGQSRVAAIDDLSQISESKYKILSIEDGITPGRLVFEELPKTCIVHDSLEYRYTYVFNESDWGRFKDAAYLPGSYTIEARALAWNRWKDKLVGEAVSCCELEIKAGHTTIIEFESFIKYLDCEVTVLPDRWFEISTREAGE